MNLLKENKKESKNKKQIKIIRKCDALFFSQKIKLKTQIWELRK